MTSLKEEIGLTCLHCGKTQLPPNRTLDSWTCGYCHSGFLSTAMLMNLISRDMVKELTKKRQIKPSNRSCPHCQSRMEPAQLRQWDGTLEYEHCRHCRLLWFEGGSIVKLLHKRDKEDISANTPEKVLTALLEKKRPSQMKLRPKVIPISGPFIPWGTLSVTLVCAILLPAALHFPQVYERLGFLPQNPWRNYGVAWLTSLFLNSRTQIHGLFALVLFGALAEKRSGLDRFLKIFLLSGVLGNFTFLLWVPTPEGIVFGSSCGIVGIATHVLFTLPYGEFLFPKERWRSPMTPVLWTLIGVGATIAVVIGWDFLFMALRNTGLGHGVGTQLGNTFLGSITGFLGTPLFWAHLFAAAVGMFSTLSFKSETLP